MITRRASAFAELVFHGLAHVPVLTSAPAPVIAASLFNPRYCEIVSRRMPREAAQPFIDDAMLLAQLLSNVEVAHAIGLFAALHGSIDEAADLSRLSLREMEASAVASPTVLSYFKRLPEAPIEIFRAALLLSANAFEASYADIVEPHVAALERAILQRASELPELERFFGTERPITLSATLGAHGRVMIGEVIVGTSALFGESIDPDATLLFAIHEHVVERAHRELEAHGVTPTWSRVEAVAVAAEVAVAEGTALQDVQTAWLSAIDRSGLAPLDPPLDEVTAKVKAALRSST